MEIRNTKAIGFFIQIPPFNTLCKLSIEGSIASFCDKVTQNVNNQQMSENLFIPDTENLHVSNVTMNARKDVYAIYKPAQNE